MRVLILTFALLLSASTVSAQVRAERWLELRPGAGAVLPTGEQRDLIDDAASFALQTAWAYGDNIHLVASFAWTPTDHAFAATSTDVNVFQYDAGFEFTRVRRINRSWDLKPFLGLGLGGRTYDYDAATLGRQTGVAGYGALGMEFQHGVTALRLEARNYVYGFTNPVTDNDTIRDDVSVSVGVAYHLGRH